MSELNSQQKQIIRTKSTRVEVAAAPGSGKTYTLLQRANYLLKSVPVEQILILSFSNATVSEIKKRVKGMINDKETSDKLSKLNVKTTHAFACGLIKEKSVLSDKNELIYLGKAIKAVKRDCQKGLLWEKVSDDTKLSRLSQLNELSDNGRKSVLSFFNVIRASRKKVRESLTGQYESLVPYAKVLIAIRNKYAVIKKAERVIDFGDMLVRAGSAIKRGAKIPFTHILVDEYQDCSAAQSHFIAQLLQSDDRSIIVFGDSYQGIYGFSGAFHTPLSSVLDNVHQMSLPLSWRLTSQTAALASAIAGLNGEKAIQTCREGEMAVLVSDKSEHEQTENIVQHVLKLIGDGVDPSEIALLARTKALLVPCEQKLLGHDIQTIRLGFKRDLKNAICVLRIVRCVERCEVEKEKVALKLKLETLMKKLPFIKDVEGLPWKKVVLELSKTTRISSLEGRYKHCAKIYLRLLGGIRADVTLRADVNHWEAKCRDYPNARAMLTAIKSMQGEGRVVTGTIHAAKGREWKHVLIVGATDGVLPLHFAKDEHAISQERNMMYVAITRAKDSVRLYHAPYNNARSRKRFENLSRFLDVPEVFQIGRSA